MEHSEGYETVRPYFLIGGTESEERVEWIASFIDEDLEKLKPGLFIDFENTPIKVEFDWGPSWDGKLTREYVYFFILNFNSTFLTFEIVLPSEDCLNLIHLDLLPD